MVLLVEKLYHSLKPSSKFGKNHRHQPEALSASLLAFRSDVSNCINKLSLNSKPGSEYFSLEWIHQCFEMLSNLNMAFAKLVVEIDYPMSKWDVSSIEEYLNYSLNLLEILNSIHSSLSHLGQARVSFSHALSFIDKSPQSAMERLKAAKMIKNPNKALKVEEMKGEKRVSSGKEMVFHEALMVVKSSAFWVCGIVVLGLSGDVKSCLETRKLAQGSVSPILMGLDSSFTAEWKEEKGVVKEVREVNEDVDCLVAAVVAGESGGAARKKLEGKLEVVEKLVDGTRKEADGLFSEILAGRVELLDILREMKP